MGVRLQVLVLGWRSQPSTSVHNYTILSLDSDLIKVYFGCKLKVQIMKNEDVLFMMKLKNLLQKLAGCRLIMPQLLSKKNKLRLVYKDRYDQKSLVISLVQTPKRTLRFLGCSKETKETICGNNIQLAEFRQISHFLQKHLSVAK